MEKITVHFTVLAFFLAVAFYHHWLISGADAFPTAAKETSVDPAKKGTVAFIQKTGELCPKPP